MPAIWAIQKFGESAKHWGAQGECNLHSTGHMGWVTGHMGQVTGHMGQVIGHMGQVIGHMGW